VRRISLDGIGALASFACALHCALLPVLFGLGAAGAVSVLDHRPTEWGIVLLAAVVGTVSAWRGFRTHGNRTVVTVLALAVLGLVVLTVSHLGADHAHHGPTAWLFAALGLVLAVSHLVNRRLCRSCRGCG
jgi:hypothetical protein